MSRTLLYTVQRVLEKLNLDPVNSLDDSEDALLVAREAETTFYDLMSRGDWPDQIDLVSITSVSDLNNPTALEILDSLDYIKSVWYDCSKPGADSAFIKELCWMEPEEFLRMSYNKKSSDVKVEEINYKGHRMFIDVTTDPTYYTSFDNRYIILDSFDRIVEDTVVGTKTTCYGKKAQTWLQDDTFVIPLQEKLYPLYLSSLAAACSIYLNMQVNQEEERRQQRGISRMRREALKTELDLTPRVSYGRKGNGRA